jgi:hypothetical protein
VFRSKLNFGLDYMRLPSPERLLRLSWWEIDRQRTTVNLSSAIRIYVYNYFRSKEGGHAEGNPAQHHLDGRSLRAQADKYRGLAEGLKDTETRTSMLRIAEDYEQMAASAEQLEGPTES